MIKKMFNPAWIFFSNTFPLIILLLVMYSDYRSISGMLPQKSLTAWSYFGITIISIGIVSFLYGLICFILKKKVSKIYLIFSMALYIVILILYGEYHNILYPSNIPSWFLPPDEIFSYTLTFLMPSVLYSLFCLSFNIDPERVQYYRLSKNIIILISIPLGSYIFATWILPLFSGIMFRFDNIFYFIAVSLTVIFFFYLIRSVYIIVLNKHSLFLSWWKFLQIIFVLILPLTGLRFNSGLNILGNFSNEWYVIITIVNAFFLILPAVNNKIFRLLLFSGRSITFSFTLYFFIVFLPFIPFSFLLILFFGLGFLVMAPSFLMVIHVKKLIDDFKYLLRFNNRFFVITLFGLLFLLIPGIIVNNYNQDRVVLKKILEYLYNSNYEFKPDINNKSVSYIIDNVKKKRPRERSWDDSNQTPYLSKLYNYIVFDNLTLSRSKIRDIEKIFLGRTYGVERRNQTADSDSVIITDYTCSSVYDSVNNSWVSTIDLELTNLESISQREFVTSFNLPAGCWISNYYLYVGEEKKYGLLAEKKSAMWVYSEVTSRSKDPGILYYLGGNKVGFRVFPFRRDEVRKTGIEFTHKEPFNIDIGGCSFYFGEGKKVISPVVENGVHYISKELKRNLSKVDRAPYYHFMIDASVNSISKKIC